MYELSYPTEILSHPKARPKKHRLLASHLPKVYSMQLLLLQTASFCTASPFLIPLLCAMTWVLLYPLTIYSALLPRPLESLSTTSAIIDVDRPSPTGVIRIIFSSNIEIISLLSARSCLSFHVA